MKKIRISKKKGILFWITGFPGSGKTAIANKIKSEIIKSYGPLRRLRLSVSTALV